MREPWLARCQDVVCLTVAGAFVALLIIIGDNIIGGILSAPYTAAIAFIVTWVVIDFVIAYLITRNERREHEKAQRKPTLAKSPPPPIARKPLPRAVARLRAK